MKGQCKERELCYCKSEGQKKKIRLEVTSRDYGAPSEPPDGTNLKANIRQLDSFIIARSSSGETIALIIAAGCAFEFGGVKRAHNNC